MHLISVRSGMERMMDENNIFICLNPKGYFPCRRIMHVLKSFLEAILINIKTYTSF